MTMKTKYTYLIAGLLGAASIAQGQTTFDSAFFSSLEGPDPIVLRFEDERFFGFDGGGVVLESMFDIQIDFDEIPVRADGEDTAIFTDIIFRTTVGGETFSQRLRRRFTIMSFIDEPQPATVIAGGMAALVLLFPLWKWLRRRRS